MTWNAEAEVVTFTCDTCPEDAEKTFRVDTSTRASGVHTAFMVAWVAAQAQGWRSFKRIGHSWTYHCRGCAEQAEADHADYNRREAERGRIKARNESR